MGIDAGYYNTARTTTRPNINKQTGTAATDLLVFLLQETIVPLLYGNPGSTLG